MLMFEDLSLKISVYQISYITTLTPKQLRWYDYDKKYLTI